MDVLKHNDMLGRLPMSFLAQSREFGTRIDLTSGSVLYEAGQVVSHVFFPLDGLISFLVASDNGNMIETGFTGPEGAAGSAFNPIGRTHFTTARVISGGKALRLSIKGFEILLSESDLFRSLVMQNNNRISERGQQLAACNLMHRLELRLSRWLLQAFYTGKNATIEITQESLAQLLGVTRARLNEALKSLEEHGALEQSARGIIQITNCVQLRQLSCECIHFLRVIPN